MRPSPVAVRIVAIALVALMAVSAVAVVATAASQRATSVSTTTALQSTSALPALRTNVPSFAPENSVVKSGLSALSRGDGPAAGEPMDCQAVAGQSFSCRSTGPTPLHAAAGATSPSEHGAASLNYTTLNWTNQTASMTAGGSDPNASGGASVAYDPGLGELVMYGAGCEFCASNSTWIYDGFTWFNITFLLQYFYNVTPPALFAVGMAYDPLWGGIIMTGGFYASGAASPETWLYNGSGWNNLTSQLGSVPPISGFAPLVYDGALGDLVSVDGCTSFTCAGIWNQTELLGGPGSVWVWDENVGPSERPVFAYQMAYDPVTSDIVLFGGRYTNATDAFNQTNTTWIYTSAGDWVNISSSSWGDFLGSPTFYPDYAAFGGMTWDGQLNAIVLFGGFDASGVVTDQTYIFDGSYWYPAWIVYNLFLAAPPARAWFAMDTNSSAVTPMIVGGSTDSYTTQNESWVFEIPPNVSLPSATPNPVDEGIPITTASSLTIGSGSGGLMNFTIGNFLVSSVSDFVATSNYSTNVTFETTFAFNYTGTAYLYAILDDFWHVEGVAYFEDVVINGNVTDTAVSAPMHPEISGGSATVSLTSNPVNGTGPYGYVWNFGDGSADSTLANVSHVYHSAGTYNGWLNTTDAGQGYSNVSFAVVVAPQLTDTSTSNVTATDVGMAVSFTGTPGGGSGSYPSTVWDFGHGTTVSADGATHTYGTVGTYQAYFNISDSYGYSNTSHVTIVVNPTLSGNATASSTSPHTGDSVSFVGKAIGGTAPFTWAWQFGDGTTSATQNASHSYGNTGTYYVNLTVTDARGESVKEHLTVTVSKASTGPLGSLTSGTGLYALIGIIVVVIVVALAAAMLMRRRRKSAPTTPPQAWSGSGAPPTGGSSTPPAGGSSGGSPPTPPAGAS